MEVNAFVHRIFKDIANKGNLHLIDEMFTEHYVEHRPMGEVVGREAFNEGTAQWRAAVPDTTFSVENVISEGAFAAWLVRVKGTHTGDALGFPATNKSFELVSPNMGRFRDGRAAEHWSEQGMMSMLTQIGILPPSGA